MCLGEKGLLSPCRGEPQLSRGLSRKGPTDGRSQGACQSAAAPRPYSADRYPRSLAWEEWQSLGGGAVRGDRPGPGQARWDSWLCPPRAADLVRAGPEEPGWAAGQTGGSLPTAQLQKAPVDGNRLTSSCIPPTPPSQAQKGIEEVVPKQPACQPFLPA